MKDSPLRAIQSYPTRTDVSPRDERHRPSGLPLSLPPRGLSRVQAAEYIGISASKFDQLVRDGRMPGPKRIDGRTVWDRQKLDVAFAELPDGDGHSDDVWSRVSV